MELKINDYKLLCNKGSAKFNEDIIGLSPYGAWVLDGATGLNNKNLVSNIVIFHTTISCLLSEIHIDKDKNISTLKISNSEHLKETIELLELVIKIGNTITETTKNPR